MSDSRLTHRQRLAALLLAGGFRTGEAARAVGVHPSTVRRWRKRPAFRETLDAEGTDLMGEVRDGLAGLSTAAYRVLTALLASDSDATALRAALQILDRVGLARLQPIPLNITHPPKIVVEYVTPDGLPYSYNVRQEIIEERLREERERQEALGIAPPPKWDESASAWDDGPSSAPGDPPVESAYPAPSRAPGLGLFDEW